MTQCRCISTKFIDLCTIYYVWPHEN